jgi:hypothetical protein
MNALIPPATLLPPGPAQSDSLIHFCGRPWGTTTSNHLPTDIAGMTPDQRLANILWEGLLRASVPFGGTQPVICLSECPGDHLLWLLTERGFPPWGVIIARQLAYNCRGGPVWYARREQYAVLTPAQRSWAVRLDADQHARSDWLHEREWRIPIDAGYSGLTLPPGTLTAILVGDPDWQPIRFQPSGWFRDPATGEMHGGPCGEPDMRPVLPPLWTTTPRLYADWRNRQMTYLRAGLPSPI